MTHRTGTAYGDAGFSKFLKNAFQRQLGHERSDFDKPIIGICNTSSEINRCHSHLGPSIDAIKRGVLQAGGIPLEFPVISLGEMFTSPTTMLYRNLLSMDVEEMVKAQPIDGVVLIGGCDKMSPGMLMGAASAKKPAILYTLGPMANGEYEGKTLGACSDCRLFWQEYRAGTIDEDELDKINSQLAPTPGHCMVMGTASTMSVCAEAMGMMVPGAASAPATHNERLRIAAHTGKTIVQMVQNQLTPNRIMTKKTFENAIRALAAVGGSTNVIIHLIAIAGRLGIDLSLKDFDDLSRTTPFLANIRPAGTYQMQEFYHAGGVTALLSELSSIMHMDEVTVTGQTLKQICNGVSVSKNYRHVIYPMNNPLHNDGGIAVLFGNLAPRGAVIKPKAASKHLLKHKGPALVFESIEAMENSINDPELDVSPDHVLVLQNAGPLGGPGMPEAGMIPIPQKLLKAGVRDMVRISDARMSGTAFGTVVLHVTPEAAVGGPLSLVKNGDMIELDVENRKISLHVDEIEINKRAQNRNKMTIEKRGYVRLYQNHVLQADEGCDFDFLKNIEASQNNI